MKQLILKRKIKACYQCYYCVFDFGDYICVHEEGVNKEIEDADDCQKLKDTQTIPDNCPLDDV